MHRIKNMQITWVYHSHYVNVVNQSIFRDMMISSLVLNGFVKIIKGDLEKRILLFRLKYQDSLLSDLRAFSPVVKLTWLSFDLCTLKDKM